MFTPQWLNPQDITEKKHHKDVLPFAHSNGWVPYFLYASNNKNI